MSGCGNESNLISIDEAIQNIIAVPKPLKQQQMPVTKAFNHYLAEDVHAEVNLPCFSQSAVDGYALCTDQADAVDHSFQLLGEVRAGSIPQQHLTHGQAVRIFTGGQIPHGTTTIARQEIVDRLDDTQIRIREHLTVNADLRHVGEEIQQGQILAHRGQYLNVGSIAALSMAGVQQVTVYRKPKVAVVVTGDEVAQAMETCSEGQIFDANAPLLHAWFQQQHLDADILHVADDAQAVHALFEQLKHNYDAIITTGGVSVGDYDFVRPCALEAGFQQVFWKVKQKPGKPLFFAEYPSAAHHCYLLGLPGNPAAVYVCMQIYGKLLLNALQQHRAAPQWFSAKLTHTLKPDARERFLRMIAYFEDGQLKVRSLAKQQSHMLSNLMQANCLVRIPSNIQPDVNLLVTGLFI